MVKVVEDEVAVSSSSVLCSDALVPVELCCDVVVLIVACCDVDVCVVLSGSVEGRVVRCCGMVVAAPSCSVKACGGGVVTGGI